MVIAEASIKELDLVWDTFLAKDAREKPHVDAFRAADWPDIRRQFNQDASHQMHIPDNLEPHWVMPGKAVLWQEQLIREPQQVDGVRRVVEVSRGWTATSPMPIGNHIQLAYYLRKGLRLRPPEHGVDVELLQSAIPPEAFQATQADEPKPPMYTCERHGMKTKGFPSWKAYIRHCVFYKEDIENMPPDSIRKRAVKFQWFCFLHNVGFRTKRHVMQHIRAELSKAGRARHFSLEQMEVKKNV